MKFDGIIFDIDGVLIDVAYSYRVAIEKTANVILREKGFVVKATIKDVDKIKDLPGFNNDWDATYTLVDLLSKGIKKEKFRQQAKPLRAKDKQGEAYKKIKDTFQTFYRKLMTEEKCLVSKRLLQSLEKMKLKLGIVTGRPRKEALFALRFFGLDKYFSDINIVALEDTAEEKPSPAPLIEAKKRMKVLNPLYVGDTINDAIAAKKAGIPCIFVGKNKLGDYQINNVNKIQEVLL